MQEKPLKKECSGGREKAWVVFLLLGMLIFTIYANTFHAAWQFDDKPNIVKESRLNIDNLQPATLWNTLFAYMPDGQLKLFRPLPRLSFALNWYWGQDRTFGYHLVNTAIHFIASLFLYLAIYNLLLTPNLKNHYRAESAASIALLSAVFWAINPIQTQAITYIVQRMAAMAAMFYVMGIYCYVKARREHEHNQRKAMQLYLGCLASFLGALMSKENAAVLPISLILVELIFFRDIKGMIRNKNIAHVSAVIVGSIVLFSIVYVAADGFGMFSKGYALRSFSMLERLLTQPRIIVLHLSQLVYPLPGRLSITHDITVSTSLLSPWTTLPSLLAVLLLIGLGLSQAVKRPLVAFAILFFFLNHVIESTILPLELIFEHRNYLPSFFFFLPFAALLIYMINYYRDQKQSMVMVMTTFVTLLIMGLGCFTYLRNRDWRTVTSLWRDAMEKAPLDARPVWNIANAIAWDKNVSLLQLDVGLALFEKALSLNHAIEENKSRILRNIGLIHMRKGAHDQAVTAFKQSLGIDPYFRRVMLDLVGAYIVMGKWDAASEQLDDILFSPVAEGVKPDYYKMKGYILLWQHQYENALKNLRKALSIEPENPDVLLNTGVTLSLSGNHVNADLFLQKAVRLSSNNIRYHYALIENSARAGDMEKARMYARMMLAEFSVKTVFDGFDTLRDDFRTAPLALEIIVPVVQKEMGQMLENMEAMARADA